MQERGNCVNTSSGQAGLVRANARGILSASKYIDNGFQRMVWVDEYITVLHSRIHNNYSVSQKSSPPPKKKNFLQYSHSG